MYPRNEDIETIAIITGSDSYNINLINNYTNILLGQIFNKIKSIMNQLTTKTITCRIVGLAIDENINIVGNFLCKEYRQIGEIDISKYKINSNCLFTKRSDFLKTLSHLINDLKITINASYLLHRYIEYKMIKSLESNIIIKNYLNSSKVNVIMVNFNNTILSYISNKIHVNDLIELNYIINLTLAHVFNNINNLDKSKNQDNIIIYQTAIKLVWSKFEIKKYNNIYMGHFEDLFRYHRNNKNISNEIKILFQSLVIEIIDLVVYNKNNICYLMYNNSIINNFFMSINYLNLKQNYHIENLWEEKFRAFYKEPLINFDESIIIDTRNDYFDNESVFYDNSENNIINFNKIIEDPSEWIFNYGNIDNIKQKETGIIEDDIKIISDVNPRLTSILNSLSR
jgi:hypothetical protein